MRPQGYVLLGACLATLSAGTLYAFSAYAPQIAIQLNISSTKLNGIGIAGNIGMYISGPGLGHMVDVKGPRRVLLLSSFLILTGYVLLYSVYTGGESGILFRSFGISVLAVAMTLAGVGSTGALSAAANAAVKGFGTRRRGTVVSIVYGCLGISALYYSILGKIPLLHDKTASYILILALGCCIHIVIAAYLVSIPIQNAFQEEHYSPVTVPFVPSNELDILVDEQASRSYLPEYRQHLHQHDQSASYFSHQRSTSFSSSDNNQTKQGRLDGLDSKINANTKPSCALPQEQIDIYGLSLIKNKYFLLLFLLEAMCSAIGLMYINNVGAMAAMITYATSPQEDSRPLQTSLVSILSLFNAAGRLSSGSLSDWFLHGAPSQYRIARVCLTLPMVIFFFISQVFASHVTRTDVSWLHSLKLPTIFLGYAYGWMFGLFPLLCLEWFGLPHLSSNMGLLNVAPGIAGNLANIIFGRIVDSHVDSSSREHICKLGPACYSEAFSLTLACGVIAFLLAGILIFKRGKASDL